MSGEYKFFAIITLQNQFQGVPNSATTWSGYLTAKTEAKIFSEAELKATMKLVAENTGLKMEDNFVVFFTCFKTE